MTVFIVLHFVKRFVWYLFVFTQYSYYRDFFCLGPASRLRECHRPGWVHYIDTTIMTVLMFLWYRLVFTQYGYYRDFFCSGTALRLRNHHRHVWVQYIDTKNITVACMSSLILSIDIQWFCYFIMFYFKLTNGEMVKMWIVKFFNGELKISIGRFVSHKYQIYSFVLFSNTKCSQQTSNS